MNRTVMGQKEEKVTTCPGWVSEWCLCGTVASRLGCVAVAHGWMVVCSGVFKVGKISRVHV